MQHKRYGIDNIHLEKKLTRKYTAFKDNLTKNVFPLVYDTKLLADVLHLGNRTLSLLWEKVKKDKMKCPQIIFKTDSVNSDFVAHNASYDAYITGCVYLALKNRVDDLKGLKNVIRMRLSHFYHLSLTNEEFIQEPHNKNTKTFVFHSKFKNYGDTDEDGNTTRVDTDEDGNTTRVDTDENSNRGTGIDEEAAAARTGSGKGR